MTWGKGENREKMTVTHGCRSGKEKYHSDRDENRKISIVASKLSRFSGEWLGLGWCGRNVPTRDSIKEPGLGESQNPHLGKLNRGNGSREEFLWGPKMLVECPWYSLSLALLAGMGRPERGDQKWWWINILD